jgi:hypothetical protein
MPRPCMQAAQHHTRCTGLGKAASYSAAFAPTAPNSPPLNPCFVEEPGSTVPLCTARVPPRRSRLGKPHCPEAIAATEAATTPALSK